MQSWLGVKAVKNGVIELSGGRYVRILEVKPIHFALRSAEEQTNIIQSFAGLLKIAPVRIQIKSVSRRANGSEYIKSVDADLKSQTDAESIALGREYVRLIQSLESRDAVSRRFFFIFEYEPIGRQDTSYAAAYAALETATHTVKSCLAQCGNAVIIPEDADKHLAEILYEYLNPKSSRTETLEQRVERVVMDTMIAQGKTIGKDPVPDIPFAHFVAPRGLDLAHRQYVIVDGTYMCFLYIRKDGYPNRVRGGWLSTLINAGEGIDVDLFLQRELRSRVLDKVAQRIRLNRTKMKSMQDTSTDYEELASAIQAGYYIKSGIANHNEDLFYASVFITISASTYHELDRKRSQLVDQLKAMDVLVGDCNYRQEEAYKTVLPLLNFLPLQKKAQRNVLTSSAAAFYPLTSFELYEKEGIFLGINRFNNSMCIPDLFNTTANKNANAIVSGTTGAGKTYFLQLLALRMRLRNIRCFIIVPVKGHEYRRACKNINGSFIKLSSQIGINIMAIRKTAKPDMELLDEDYAAEDCLLSKKIQVLLAWFSLLVPDMKNEEEQLLDEALMEVYRQFGITYDNESIYADVSKCVLKRMPVLGDLYQILKDNPRTERIAIILNRFIHGSAQYFNQQDNVDLGNPYTVFDLSDLRNSKLQPLAMLIVLDFVWDCIKEDCTQRKAVIIDELWQLIGSTATKQSSDFVVDIYRLIRAYSGAAISASQNLTDYDSDAGRVILNTSKTKILLNLETDEARKAQRLLNLSSMEAHSITQFGRGEALLITAGSKVPLSIIACKKEHELITTDRTELKALLEKKKREREGSG